MQWPDRRGPGPATALYPGGDPDILDAQWCMRLARLRRAGRIGIVFADSGALYLADPGACAWDRKERIPASRLRQLIEEREAAAEVA